jgi:hypothetical protein
MSQNLFLYGTLLPSEAPKEIASIVKRFRRLGSRHVRGKLYDFGEFPGAVVDPSSRTLIHGELALCPLTNEYCKPLIDMRNLIQHIPGKAFSFAKKRWFGWLMEAFAKDGFTSTIEIPAMRNWFGAPIIFVLK